MPSHPLEDAPLLDRLRGLIDRLDQVALHVLSPVERVGDLRVVRCGCGHVMAGDRIAAVCPVETLDAHAKTLLTTVLAADVQWRDYLRAWSAFDQTELKRTLAA